MSFKSKNKKREIQKEQEIERNIRKKEFEQLEEENRLKKEKELYCKSRELRKDHPNLKYLTHPVELMTKSLQIPYVRVINFSKDFDPISLNNSNLIWKTEWLNIDYMSSNYTDYSQMTYFWNDRFYPGLDIAWFDRQLHYLQTLTEGEVLTIRGYTFKGDKIINKWCIEDKSWWSSLIVLLKKDLSHTFFPFFCQLVNYIVYIKTNKMETPYETIIDLFDVSEKMADIYVLFLKLKNNMINDSWKPFWNNILSLFQKDMNRLIKNAPKLHHCLTTWRGSKTQYWGNDPILFKSYTSSTLDLKITEEFRNTKGYLLKIILPKNTPCLFAAGISNVYLEAEIILATESIFTQEKDYEEDIIQEKDYNLETSTDADDSLCTQPSILKMSFLKFQEYKENLI